MNWLDIFILAFILVGVGIGMWRGFFHEIVGTIGLLLALVVANWASPHAAPTVGSWVGNATVGAIIVWTVIFLLAMVLIKGVAYLLARVVKAISLGWVNRLAGGLFAALQFILIAAVAVSVLEVVCAHVDGLKITPYLQSSRLVPWLHRFMAELMPWAYAHVIEPAMRMMK